MRIRATHVGSLVRPDELIEYMHKIDRGDDVDQAAYEECLTRSVRDVVRRQRDAGVDVVSDGEYGKSSWNYYVYSGSSGFELRSDATVRMADVGEGSQAEDPVVATDWARFADFYAEYFAKEQGEYEQPDGTWVCVADVGYTGQAAIARDIANCARRWRPRASPRAFAGGRAGVAASRRSSTSTTARSRRR